MAQRSIICSVSSRRITFPAFYLKPLRHQTLGMYVDDELMDQLYANQVKNH